MNTITIDKKKYVLLAEAEYTRLVKGVPELPAADSKGNMPALAFAEAAIAGNIVRDRKAVGMSQKELAQAAGIRVEILNRAERGVTVPSVRTLTKIENALVKAGLKRKHLAPIKKVIRKGK
jgi:DNA-binding XRE family transcriptional regulator